MRPVGEQDTPSKSRRSSDPESADLAPLRVSVAEEAVVFPEEKSEVGLLPLAQAGAVVRDPAARSAPQAAPRARASTGYLRKADWLRAQFLPEIEVLDFRGLFVGNKGLWILEDRKKRGPETVDPNRIADLLFRGNGYRRGGDHVKALMCYQELVELDPQNADFRFLLETSYQAIATSGSGE